MTTDFYYCATCDLAYELMDTDVYFDEAKARECLFGLFVARDAD